VDWPAPCWKPAAKIVALLAETGLSAHTSPARPCATSIRIAGAGKHPVLFAPPASGSRGLGDRATRPACARKALARIDLTQWIPTWGKDRIRGMIEVRPDWCLSRQRLWACPSPPMFVSVRRAFPVPEAMESWPPVRRPRAPTPGSPGRPAELHPAGTRWPKVPGHGSRKRLQTSSTSGSSQACPGCRGRR